MEVSATLDLLPMLTEALESHDQLLILKVLTVLTKALESPDQLLIGKFFGAVDVVDKNSRIP